MAKKIDVKEQLGKLAQLQDVDAEMFDLRAQGETFSARIKEMDDSLEAKKGGIISAEEELKRLKVSRSEKETEVKAREEKISKHQGELNQIKSNKEYTALLQEIESIKADISLLEEDIINLFDEIEEAESKCEEEKRIFEEEGQKAENEKNAIKEEEKKISGRLDELKARRTEFSGTIEPDIRRQYERILEKRGRVALARVTGEFCGECNMQLRPQKINEAKLKKNIVFCENCSRMLYAED